MAHAQKAISQLRFANGIPYIGEEDANGVQVTPSLVYLEKSDGTFDPASAENPLPVTGVVLVGNFPENPVTLVGYSSDPKPTNVPKGSDFLELDTKNVYVFDGSTWVVI